MFNFRKAIEIAWIVVIIGFFVASLLALKNGILEDQAYALGVWGPAVFVLLKISTLVIAPLGGTPLYFVAGSVWGPYYGLALTLLGDILGSTICFFLSRSYGHRVIKSLAGEEFLQKVTDTVSILKDVKSLVKARLTFIVMPEILSYAVGLSKINFLTFSLVNTFFFVLVDFTFVFFGSEMLEIMARHSFLFYSVILLIVVMGLWSLRNDYKHKVVDNVQGM